MRPQKRILAILLPLTIAICAAGWIPGGFTADSHSLGAPFRTLIVGGGPDQEHNQVAIESNVRYVQRLLPAGSKARVLFTDGDPQSKNVLCEDSDNKTYFRTPEISQIDGPSDYVHVKSELARIAADAGTNSGAPVLLYFTGHGSPDRRSEYNNNHYDLWDHKEFTVRNLSSALKSFPKTTPITLVMVECFSGAFGNVLFDDGDPSGPLADLSICGYYASVANREAAGCTPEINEANYRDFTSFFFAALTGVDRLGRPVTGADYNHDGKVGMNEAFAYTLIHDDSIDTPVCTSDVFLRRFVKTLDAEIMATPFSQIQSWASPAQLEALNALSKSIDLTGDDRVQRAYDNFRHIDAGSMELHDVRLYRFVRLAKSVVLAHSLRTSADESLKAQFAALTLAESGNPLR